jgi:hypothetical protein
MPERSIDDLVEALRGCKENNRQCSVLIGAGCSKSAGITALQLFDQMDFDRKAHQLNSIGNSS